MQHLHPPSLEWLWFSAVCRNVQFLYCGNGVTPAESHTGGSCVLPWVR